MVEPTSRFEEVRIPLPPDLGSAPSVSGVLGVPEWWPTGSRVGIVLAHDRGGSRDDPVLVGLHRGLTARGYLALRFNFPFAELGRRSPDKDPVLDRVFWEAVQLLGRDPTAAPAHLVLAGKGLGSRVAARVALSRLRVEGVCFLAYPLHPAGKPDRIEADQLFRLISPILFCQGSRDKYCDLDVLRRTLARVGAPTTLHVVAEADHHLKVPKKSGRTAEDVEGELLVTIENWIHKILET